jgi:hypothetical protein
MRWLRYFVIKLAQLKIRRCGQCGKLFKQEPGKELCAQCQYALEPGRHRSSPGRVPQLQDEHDGSTFEPLPALLREPSGEGPPPEEHCVRCQAQTAVEGSEFCFGCNLDLYRSLGDAAELLFTSLERMEERRHSTSLNVISAYEAKRRRTATSRIDPAGARRVK